MKRRLIVVAVSGLIIAALPTEPSAQRKSIDWPQWRGLNRDAVGTFSVPQSWPERLTLKWRAEVGLGHASPVAVGGRVYLHTRKDDNEVVTALDAATGKTIWQDSYPAPYTMNSAAARHGPGPKSTPVVGGGKIFTLGISGILSALDATTGKVLWRKDAPAVPPLYGTATSPIVDGRLLIAHVGGHDKGALTAFDVDTGAVKWAWDEDGPAYGSPMIGMFGGTKQVVTYTQKHLAGVDAANGRLLWRLPFTTRSTQNTITPLFYRNLILSSGLDKGISALGIVKRGSEWATETAWENPDVSFYMSDPVLVGDLLLGLSTRNKGQWVCLDAKTGKLLWNTDGREAVNAAIVRSGDVLFLLKDDGEMIVAKASQKGFEPLRRYTVAETPTWAHPALVSDGIFVKDVSSLMLWSLR